jgi:threonine dehydrogenase-like Zn-dependent dehydrogenase
MRGIVFDLSLPRYALGKALGKQLPSLYWGPLSCVSFVPKIDLTNIWAKELAIQGTYYYAPEADGRHTIDLATELLSGDGARSVDALITHSFPLEKYREAIVANVDRGNSKAMKTVFKPAVRA